MKLIQTIIWILVSLLVSTTSLEAQTNGSEPIDFGTTGDTANNPIDMENIPAVMYFIKVYIANEVSVMKVIKS